jgi:hypothetical protein
MQSTSIQTEPARHKQCTPTPWYQHKYTQLSDSISRHATPPAEQLHHLQPSHYQLPPQQTGQHNVAQQHYHALTSGSMATAAAAGYAGATATAAAAVGSQVSLQAVAEHLVDECQWSTIVPEEVLARPKRPWAAKVLLKRGIVTQRHLRQQQRQQTTAGYVNRTPEVLRLVMLTSHNICLRSRDTHPNQLLRVRCTCGWAPCPSVIPSPSPPPPYLLYLPVQLQVAAGQADPYGQVSV